MKKLLLTLSLLLTFSFAASSVAAQTDGVEAPDLEGLEAEAYDVDGLQSVYDRTFSVDIATMMDDPDAAEMDPSAFMNVITVQGMTFDSEDSGKAYIEDMKSQMETSMEEDESGTFDDMEITDLEDFDAEGIRVDMDMPDLEMAASMLVFVEGNHVFNVMVVNADIDQAKTTADEVTQFVLDGEIETEEVSFSDDGTSTGGVYDRMPTTDDDVVGDLTGVMDTELFVADE